MAAGRRPKAPMMSQPHERQPEDASAEVTQSPEFAQAVALATQAALDKAMGPINEAMAKLQNAAPVAGAPAMDIESLFRQMALSIAEISDQGTDRKRVAPEVLAQRAKSHGLMIAAIIEAKRAHEQDGVERPLYRAIGKMYLNERFIEPFTINPATKEPVPVELYWSGVPNEVMRPLNDPAKEIHRHFCDSIGNVEKKEQQAAMWISAGGLVIKGEGPQRRQVGTLDNVPQFSDDLDVVGQNDPTKPFINVLGNVAPAARQNYAGGGAN